MKKLKSHQVEERLVQLGIKIFTANDISLIFQTNKRATEAFLSYNTKRGVFTRLKKSLYVLRRNLPSDFFIANKLYFPSYISLESALSFYNLIPETVYSVTSVTPKATRNFNINGRVFSYRTMKKEAFTGFVPKKIDGEVVYLAEPEKAVADFCYFVHLGQHSFNERLRKEKLKFKKIETYLRLFQREKLITFTKELFKT